MAEKANVTNIEALEDFRSKLVVFIEKASVILDEASEEVKRTRIWLQSEQKLRLDHEMRRRKKELEQVEQELFSARLSGLQETKTGHQMIVNKKRREIRDLENKLRAVSAWLRNYDSKVEIEARKVDKLRHHLDSDMVKGLQYLQEAVKNLNAYASPGGGSSGSSD